MKKALMLGSAAVAMTAIAAPIAALDIDFSGRSRFHIEGGEEFNASNDNGRYYVNDNTMAAAINPGAAVAATGTTAAVAASPAGTQDINNGELKFSNDERLHVNVDTSNCCIKYGAMLRLEDASIKSDIYIAGDWGRLDMGNIDNAKGGAFDTSVFNAGPLYGDSSVTASDNDMALKFSGNNVDATNIVYTGPALAGFTPKIGWDGEDVNGSLAGSLGPIGLKVSTSDNGEVGAMATYASGPLSLAAYGGEDDDSDSYAGASIMYSMGALAISLSGVEAEGKDGAAVVTEEDVTFGAKYKIATGLTASASVKTQDNSVLGSVTSYKARLQLDF